MKKLARLMLCLTVIAALMSGVCAQAAQRAAQFVQLKDWKHYPSFAWNQETGEWSVQSYQADALAARFWNYGIKNSSRAVVFHLAAEGSSRNGVWTPVLRFYHIDGKTINARAVSVLVDGKRYDMAASSGELRNGRYTAECITVPLNAEGLQVVELLCQAESAAVRLIGDEIHMLDFDRNADTERRKMEGASLALLQDGMAMLNELGAQHYQLWDLSADAWEMAYGYRPQVTEGSIGTELCGAALSDALGMVAYGASGEAAEKAQERLMEHGFLMGTLNWQFDANAENATLRAQQYLGRVPTGCYDEALDQALQAGRSIQTPVQPSMHKLGATAELAVERYWFASGVSPSRSMEGLRSVINADNVFLAADGLIRNLSAKELHLFMQMDAQLICNGEYVYEAELVCEGSNGTLLDSRLLPMAQARLMIFAEIPAALAQDEAADWCIVCTSGEDSLTFELQ